MKTSKPKKPAPKKTPTSPKKIPNPGYKMHANKGNY